MIEQHLLGSLGRAELETWARRLDRLANACGCAEGAVVTVVCLLVGLGEVVLYPASGLPSRIARYVLVVAASLLAGVLGKVLGLGLARARLRLERARFMHLVGRRKGENDVVLR